MRSSLSSSRSRSTVEVACGGADDDEDPPKYVTGAGSVCGVTVTDETGAVARSVNLAFFMLGSASDTERDTLSCASQTRALSEISICRHGSDDSRSTLFRVITRRHPNHRCIATNTSRSRPISGQLD